MHNTLVQRTAGSFTVLAAGVMGWFAHGFDLMGVRAGYVFCLAAVALFAWMIFELFDN